MTRQLERTAGRPFSTRVPSNLRPNRLTVMREALARDGVDIVDLTVSNPTAAELDYPEDLLLPLAHTSGLRYRPDPRGLETARQAVSADFGRRGVPVEPDRIVLTSSTSEAYSLLFKTLCDPGDEVLVPRPSYPLFEHLTRLDAVRAVPYALDDHASWRVDLGGLEHSLTPTTKAVLAVSPNNPTGSFLHADELAAVVDLCRANNSALVVDEVFSDYVLDDGLAAPRGVALHADGCVVFGLAGLSKSIGLPQAKLGWIGVSGPDRLVDEALARLEFACDAYLSVSTPVQIAAPELLERGAGVRRQIHARVRRNYASLRAAVATHPATSLLPAEGGWSAVVRVPAVVSEEDLVLALLKSAHVLVHPGYFFDFPREAYLVVSLLPPGARFDDGVSRILDHVDYLARKDDPTR